MIQKRRRSRERRQTNKIVKTKRKRGKMRREEDKGEYNKKTKGERSMRRRNWRRNV